MRVGVTGISSDLGQALLSQFEADHSAERVVAFDVALPLYLALHDFFRFSWLADGRRAMQELGFYARIPTDEAIVGAVSRGH